MGRKPGSKNKSKAAATTGEVLGEPGNISPMSEGQSPEQGGEEGIGVEAPKRKARAKQMQIPGTERPKLEAIEAAAEDYVTFHNAMQESVKAFKEKKDDLLNLMHAHANELPKHEGGGYCYAYDDMIITVTPKDEVLKVKHIDADEYPEVINAGAPADNSDGE